MVYFTSDLHLGHKAIPKYREPFADMEEHDNYVIERILELGKRDVLHILGDFLFDGPHYDMYIERLKKAKCRIKLCMGNHDSLKLYKPIFKDNGHFLFEVQLPFFSYKNMWLSHPPIHPKEMRNRKGNIHGHLHMETLEDPNYYNVNLDVNNYQFVTLERIREYFDDKSEVQSNNYKQPQALKDALELTCD